MAKEKCMVFWFILWICYHLFGFANVFFANYSFVTIITIENQTAGCIPITFNNAIKACFFYKEYNISMIMTTHDIN